MSRTLNSSRKRRCLCEICLVGLSQRPAFLADVFLLVNLHPCRKNCRPPQVTDYFGLIVTLHHRQAANVSIEHFGERGVKRFVGKGNHKIGAASFGTVTSAE